MDLLTNVVAVAGLTGIVFMAIGPAVIGAGMPFLLLVGLLDPDGVPGSASGALQSSQPEEPHVVSTRAAA